MRLLVSAAAVGYEDFPVGTATTWDVDAAEARWRRWSGARPGAPASAWAKYRRGFGWYDAGAADKFGSYKLLHHDIEGGRPVLSRPGLMAAGGVLQGARGGVNIPTADRAAVKSHLGRHYRKLGMMAPWDRREAAAAAEPAAERVRFDARVALADEDKRLVFLIVLRANEVLATPARFFFSPDEVERAAHRFMEVRALGINHACATDGCLHGYGAHVAGGNLGPCAAAGCTCTAYHLLAAPARMVESFVWRGEQQKTWAGKPMAVPFEAGDHVVVLKIDSGMLWAFREAITGCSWEGTLSLEPIASPA